MQGSVSLGSSLNLAVSPRCSYTSSARSQRSGAGAEARNGASGLLMGCWTSQSPFLVGSTPFNPFRCSRRPGSGPSFPSRRQYDRQTKAFARFFDNGTKWGHKEPLKPGNPQNHGNGALVSQSWVQKNGANILQKSAWAVAIALMGGGALLLQARAQNYIERNVLPSAAGTVAQYFGREVQLGKVQKLTPLGVTLGPCSVGAHDEEFTCAEIPGIELRVLPIASLRKGQLVVDAVITEPHILVSQKEDWTWLGIPISLEERVLLRQSSEPNIDSRTKVRRLAREETGRKFATDRKQAARNAANRGYELPGANVDSKQSDKTLKSKDTGKQQQDGDLEFEGSENEEEIDTTASYLGVDEGDGIKAGQHVEERLTECDESNPGFELKNSVLGAKVWIDTNIFRPAKRRILRKWTKQGIHPLSKLSLQRKNLNRSAAAARAYFEKLDKSSALRKGSPKMSDALFAKDDSLSLVPVPASERTLVRPASQGMTTRDKLPGPSRPGNSKGVGSADASGVRVHPFVSTGGSTRPPMSISSSWGARAERTEDGNHGRLFPNLAMKIEDAVHKNRGIEKVSFRKINSVRANLKSLGMKTVRAGRQGQLDVKSEDRRTEAVNLEAPHTVTNHSMSKPRSKRDENGLSRVESVKAALVQAIRERQDMFSSMGQRGSSSTQSLSSTNSVSPKHAVLDSEFPDMNKIVAEDGQVVERSEESSASIGGEHTRNEMIDKNLSKNFLKDDGVKIPDAGVDGTDGHGKGLRFRNDSGTGLDGGIAIQNRFEGTMETRLMDKAKSMRESTETRAPIALNSVYFRDGTLMLLAFGDREPRVMEKATGQVKFGNSYEQINVKVTGSPKEFRVGNGQGDGGKIFVKVAIDVKKQEWHLKVRGRNLFAPLFEKLFELPLDWSGGRATGEVHAWMLKDDPFPSFGGRVDVKGLDFAIWDAPAPFKGVSGTLFFQEQRLFFHNASGLYGEIPLQVSGDMDLNPDDGEYRLSCQVAGVEANALMKTLKVQPPPFPVAGALKGVVHCRGPLDAPIFEGSAEVTGKQMALVYDAPDAPATRAVKDNERDGAIAAFDRIPFTSASASFTFNTDDCMAELYGLRAAPVGGGEIRGSGNLWICPEGELDLSSVNVDCSGTVVTGPVLRCYSPSGMDLSSLNFGTMHGKANIRGALLMPVFDIKWDTPEAQGSFDGAHGDLHICREAITLNSSASAYDLSSKIHTLYPPISVEKKQFEFKPGPAPTVEGLDLNLDMRGFDIMGLAPVKSPRIDISHLKVSGTVALNGEVPKRGASMDPLGNETAPEEESDLRSDAMATRKIISELVGKVSLSGLKLNQLLVAPELNGSFEVSPSSFKMHTTGGPDGHLHVFVSEDLASDNEVRVPDPFFEEFGVGTSFSLHRGPLRADFHHQPGQLAKLEVRNLQLDELELASLRGDVQKAELGLNFLKRRGQGCLSVRQPRCSGIQGESLDIAARWSGDVITVDKSVLELAKSRYEMQGEYVLPSLRDRSGMDKGKEEGMLVKAMAGQLGNMITSMGRWRVRLDVPEGEMSDMLPIARLLSRSSDPEVVSRSKELFLQGVGSAGFSSENLKQLREYIRNSKGMATPEGSTETYPLPGLAELKGSWRGTLAASGGGDGDTYADFDFRGDEWEWGPYKTRRVIAVGDYCNNDGLRFQKLFIQKDRATLHADGTLLGPKPNLHFAVLNLPVDLVPPLLHAVQSSTPEDFLSSASRRYNTPIKGILYMEGDLRGHLAKPQCDLQIRLLDGSIGGISLGKAEMAASLTSASRLAFNAVLEPSTHSGHVRIQGSLPTDSAGLDEQAVEEQGTETEHHKRAGSWGRERGRDRKDEQDDDASDETLETGGEEGWEKRLAESLKALDGDSLESGAVQVDAAVKDGGMMLLTAISPGFQWIQGNADIKLQVRGTLQQPSADGTASFHRVTISSPVLPRPLSNLGGSIRIENNQVRVEELVGRVGRRGLVEVKGKLPLRNSDFMDKSDAIDVRAESLEVRAKHAFSGQVNSRVRVMGSLIEPELTGVIKLSNGDVYLSQEKGASPLPSLIPTSPPGGGHSWMHAASSAGRHDAEIVPVPKQAILKPRGSTERKEDDKSRDGLLPFAVRLRGLKFLLGPELRMVYPLILNFAVSGELELNGFADIPRVMPRGMLTFENGDINLVATQLRLSKDHPNRAKFEPEQGLDPTLDLALIGSDWQLKVQGRARNWQDNIVVSSTRSGEDDALTRTEAARVFESQLAESLLEQDGQLAFKKLAAATVETLMPKIETKGEFGQARWRLVSAPQISNLLSLDPTIDPFKSLANLSFGAEVEVQLGKHLQASVARRLKESEMATEWTLLYQLNSKLRLLFSSIPSVDNRLLFEYSATSQN